MVQRKKILLGVVQEGIHVRIVPFKTVNSKKIKDHFAESIQNGYEGLILKNARSEYESGKRSSHWLKIKQSETIDVNVIGATKSTGSIAFGALILEKDGQYFGKVGTGFSDLDRKEILEFLEKNRGITDISIPADLDILLTTRRLPAEIKANEIVNGKPRAPVWVRFRWD